MGPCPRHLEAKLLTGHLCKKNGTQLMPNPDCFLVKGNLSGPACFVISELSNDHHPNADLWTPMATIETRKMLDKKINAHNLVRASHPLLWYPVTLCGATQRNCFLLRRRYERLECRSTNSCHISPSELSLEAISVQRNSPYAVGPSTHSAYFQSSICSKASPTVRSITTPSLYPYFCFWFNLQPC